MSSSEEQALYDIAVSNTSNSGYALSLYHILKGEILIPDHPTINSSTQARSSKLTSKEVLIFPNPVEFELQLINDSGKTIKNIKLYDLYGKEIL